MTCRKSSSALPPAPPSSTGWITNPAGIAFNHDFGAGVINATAAVNLAATWTLKVADLSATDRTVTNSPGSVTQVEFFANDISLGTDTTAPYSFTYTPTPGNHTLVTKATDHEAAIGTSSSVNISVINQAPVITAATLSASGQSFSDVPLTVSSITATDPENSPLSYS